MGIGKAVGIGILVLAAGVGAGVLPPSAQATELKPETIIAFDRCIQLIEARMGNDILNGNFLYIDRLPEGTRLQIFSQLRAGQLYIERIPILENGMPIEVPHGLIHHWIGIAFIPGATYSRTLAILLDFDKQAEIYKPDVRRSKLLETHGNRSKIFLQYFKKSMVTAVLDANFDSEYLPLGDSRGEIRSYSTRIAEVQNFGEPDEMELPVGSDHGYLWRLNSYWRLEAKDGGVYLQVESAALSRPVPVLFAWLINGVVENLSRATVRNLLTSTCKAVNNDLSPGRGSTGGAAQSCLSSPPDSQELTAPK